MSNTIGRSLNLYTIKPADRIERATYDVFLGAVVAAETFEEARSIPPNSYCFWDEGAGSWYSWKRVQVGTGVFADDFARGLQISRAILQAISEANSARRSDGVHAR